MSDDSSISRQVMSVLVRLVGVAVLFVGVWAGVKVILEAWALYNEPARIERLAQAIESGSNLDTLFATRPGTQGEQAGATAATGADATLRLSYFAAWFIALMLLLVIGTVAMSAISTGGRLALYDTQVRSFARAVSRQMARG